MTIVTIFGIIEILVPFSEGFEAAALFRNRENIEAHEN